MESSEQEFQWEDLLIGEVDPLLSREIRIIFDEVQDEDGGDALRIHITSHGFDEDGLLDGLQLAFLTAWDEFGDDGEDEDE